MERRERASHALHRLRAEREDTWPARRLRRRCRDRGDERQGAGGRKARHDLHDQSGHRRSFPSNDLFRWDPPGRKARRIFFVRQPKMYLRAAEITSPMVSSTAAQSIAEVKLAIWNCQYGISKMPATSGTTARKGPKKRPMKMPGMPHAFTKRSPRGIISGWRDSGQMRATEYSSFRPTQ